MARPTLAAHPKFAKLVARLRTTPSPRATARGALELIWEAGYGAGDPLIGDAEAVEAIADWCGAPGELARHLVATGFLDLANDGQHYIHDLADHAPAYVAQRMAREEERRRAGTTISEIRAKAASKRGANDSKRNSFAANVAPPAPAPAPIFSPPAGACDPGAAAEQAAAAEMAIPEALAAVMAEDETQSPPATAPFRSWAKPYPLGAKTTAFKAVYDRYPRKDAENRAAAAFQEASASYPGGEAALSTAILAAFDQGMLKRHPYNGPNDKRPYLETVIAEWRWRDAPSAPDDHPSAVQPARATGPPRDVRFGHARAEDSKHTTTGEVKL